ncbi:MAG TPA: MBOAT family O-acyltransferase [Candidatus Limnocylindria bacterium]|nr:MBOAT family O-acyltransferase [Candidatus Limnocylindria bacterium]
MPGPFDSPDALVLLRLPALSAAKSLLERAGMSGDAVGFVVEILSLGLFAAVVAGLVWLRRLRQTPGVTLAFAASAAALGVWVALHRGSGFESSLARGDHLLLAGFGGAAIRVLPTAARVRVLLAVSAGMLLLLAGTGPAAIVLGGMAAGTAVQRLDAAAPNARTALVQGAIMAATLGACRLAWTEAPALGLGAQGLFAFMLLRHVSWLVDVRRGAGGTLLDYWSYQLFYPCCYGATERYADFRARNPEPGTFADDARLFRVAVRGAVYYWLAFRIPVDLPALLAPSGVLPFHLAYLALFVRSALFVMGIWATLEALALGWGVRIHPNFAGILRAQSPSQFWYAWRGTMTRWLVEYVYIPLGGNRAHQTRNVFAVFAVSGAWHAMGVPFLLTTEPGAVNFVPIAAWALVNALVLSAALAWRGQRWSLWPTATPALVRRAVARLATWAFGGVTATFLAFSGDLAWQFPDFVLRLVGVR